MDVTSTLITAANIMLTGMVGVFVFLVLLIFIVKLVAKLVGEEAPIETKNVKKTSLPKVAEGVSPAHVAAISAAVAQYKKQHQQG
ncbi:OadG family transporter subunit [Pseudoalteromonas xiamenensis]|uniref:OadG family protein n=1 Tax=Pseudoalteromonas xiamenensis TaxID=882626 RepID=UPI0027E4F159|nr:OadG family transporter subunit [Pseudoalteromonas xiamenensis]WMN60928.1 OadG family transporter subunit [Pseudoalteromonas xiamenensis]